MPPLWHPNERTPNPNVTAAAAHVFWLIGPGLRGGATKRRDKSGAWEIGGGVTLPDALPRSQHLARRYCHRTVRELGKFLGASRGLSPDRRIRIGVAVQCVTTLRDLLLDNEERRSLTSRGCPAYLRDTIDFFQYVTRTQNFFNLLIS